MSSFFIPFQSIRSIAHTFAERVGHPDEVTSALGHVFIGFSWLEQSLERHVAELAKLGPSVAPALSTEMSFESKVAVLSNLVRLQLPLRKFNTGTEDSNEVWGDFLRMLSECEKLREKFLHDCLSPCEGEPSCLTRTTVSASRGVIVMSEDLTADHLLDAYDYILNVDWGLNEFFLLVDEEEDAGDASRRVR
jgi:hypothetical protein